MKHSKFRKVLSVIMIMILAVQLLPVRELSFANTSNPDETSIDLSGVAPAQVEINLKHENTITGTVSNDDPGSGILIPGEDETTSDDIVRTLDTVTYDLSYSIKEESKQGQNVILKGFLSEPAGQTNSVQWDESLKSYSGMQISADGKTFEYTLGDLNGGEAFTFSAVAYVPPTANGNTFEAHFEISGDNTSTITTPPVESRVSAIPKVDLILLKYTENVRFNSDDTIDITPIYGLALAAKQKMGMELIEQPVTFDIDLSQITVPDVRLDTDRGYGINNDGALIYSLPYGKIRSGQESKSVSDSGQITMVQNAPGENIQVTIKDMDTSLDHYPTQKVDGTALPVDYKYFFAGYFKLAIDNEKLPGEQTPIPIECKNLVVNGISGQSNFGSETEPTDNNSHTYDIIKRDTGVRGFGMRVDYVKDIHSTSKLDTMSSSEAGDGTVVPGQVFGVSSYLANSGYGSLSDVAIMLKFDPDVLELSDYVKNSSTPLKVKSFGGNVDQDDLKISYGTNVFADYEAMRTATQPKDGIWYDSYEAAQAAAPGQVSMVKVEVLNGAVMMPGAESIRLCLSVRSKATDLNGDTNEIGSLLPVFLAGKANEVNGGAWNVGSYDPVTNKGVTLGQRLKLSEILARIEKRDITSNAIEKSTYELDGDRKIDFELQPSYTGELRSGEVNLTYDVYVEDYIPDGMEYVKDSASVEPDEISLQPSGETKVTWNLGKASLNKTIDPITYSALIPANTKNNTILTNTALIKTDSDLSDESLRMDTFSITVLNNKSWAIREKVLTPLVEVGEPLEYQIEYTNLDDKDMTDFDLITVLPSANDGTGLSRFDGAYELAGVTVSHMETILATMEPADQIELDPDVVWPKWSLYSDLSEDEKKQVTGLRFQSPLYGKDEASREIRIELLPKHNAGGNTYGTFVSGRTANIDQLIRSKNVSAQVVASTIGDTVWADLDSNGEKSAGETGLTGVTVRLFKENVEQALTNTDGNGNYSFSNLHSGTYEVVIDTSTLPEGAVQVFDPDGALDHKNEVVLGVDDDHIKADFGYNFQYKGRIGDRIYHDLDEDGKESAGDTGIEGVSVTLTNTDTNTVFKTKTDASGLYEFTALKAGAYTVTVDQNTVSDLVLSIDPDTETDGVYSLSLNRDEIVTNVDFGFKTEKEEKPVQPPSGQIGDRVYQDVDKDGKESVEDVGLEGVKVTLTDTVKNAQTQVWTDASGNYVFTGLEPGSYQVAVDMSTAGELTLAIDPDAEADGVYKVSLNKDEVVDSADFGFIKEEDPTEEESKEDDSNEEDPTEDDSDEKDPGNEDKDEEKPAETPKGQIGDYVFLDINANGIQDGDDQPLENVTLELTLPDDTKLETKTNADGLYTFDGLEAGEYWVKVFASSLSLEHILSIDPDSVIDGAHKISLEKDQAVTTVDFGFILKQDEDSTDDTKDETKDETGDDSKDETEDKDQPDSDNTKDDSGDTSDDSKTSEDESETTDTSTHDKKDKKKDKTDTSTVKDDPDASDNTNEEKTETETENNTENETIDEMIKNGKLKVNYVDKLTNERLTDTLSETAPVGAQYSTLAKDFDMYELVDEPSNKDGLIKEDETVVTYYYTKIITIDDGDVPLGMIVLPKTGDDSKRPYVSVGSLLILLGIVAVIFRRRDEKCIKLSKETK